MQNIRTLLSLLLAASSLVLNGCTVYYEETVSPPRTHVYSEIYLYSDGCWADGYWYAPCPYSPGMSVGYYYRSQGRWYFLSNLRWQARDRPPPHRWYERSDPPPQHDGRRKAQPNRAQPRREDRRQQRSQPTRKPARPSIRDRR